MNDDAIASPVPMSRFELALAQAREGKLEAALESWNLLIADVAPPRHVGTPKPQLAAALMQRAWVLMDLGRFTEARVRLEGKTMRACLSSLPAALQFEYWFSLGNVLGELDALQPMDEAFGHALQLAAGELGSTDLCVYVWMNLIYYARRMQAWRYAARACETAWGFARYAGIDWLQESTRGAWLDAVGQLGRGSEAAG